MLKRILSIAAGVMLALAVAAGAAHFAALWGLWPSRELNRSADTLRAVLELANENYVDPKAAGLPALTEAALAGLVGTLDPHSEYMTAATFKAFNEDLSSKFGGIGVQVELLDGRVVVITPIAGTPGERAGIIHGDEIVSIDGQKLAKAAMEDVLTRLRGKPGTKIALTLVRPGRDKPLDVSITREVIVQRPVKWEVKGDVGYININTFSENTGADTRGAIMAIDKALGHKPLGYVVDLRANGGGLLSQAIEVSDAFLNAGEIVSQRGRAKTDIERYFAKPGDDARGLPVVVLTDSGTASASEIVAGALQDHHRGIVMGEKTFGKGSVQTLLQLGPQTALRLTTARYYTPSGRSVQEGGIEPDIRVPQLSDPDYKTRPVFREADLRRHLINEIKADNAVLEEDTKDDPRFSMTPEQLKKIRIDDFQLWYALKTVARVGGPTQVAAVTAAMAKDFKPEPETK